MEFYLATQNSGKLAEISLLLSETELDLKLMPENLNILEGHESYFQNCLKKAEESYQLVQKPVLADDSGIEILPIGKKPGVDSAIWGGQDLTMPQRWQLLRAELGTLPPEKWEARFVTFLCYFDGRVPYFFRGEAKGIFLEKPRGEHGFGYDPVFYSHDLQKTFGEASAEEKREVSARGRAVLQFKDWILSKVSLDQ